MSGCKVGGNLLAPPEVHFVGCLPGEGCMWNYGVVLLDVEFDQLLQGSETVERMQIEPAVLERAPPGFDQGIGIADLNLGKYAAQLSETKKVVDLLIDVLDARVGDHGGTATIVGEILRRLDKDLTGGLWPQARSQFPGENSAAEIVQQRMQIRARAVEQLDDRQIDVPIVIWFARPNALLGRRRGRSYPRLRASRAQVDGEANTFPVRWACRASDRMVMWR